MLSAGEGQKGTVDTLELKIEMVVSYHVFWKLNLGPLEELGSALNC